VSVDAIEGWDQISSPDFDEFSLLESNARYRGLPWNGRPAVERRAVDVGDGQHVSTIVWGDEPELVFLHGGGQNAHTWDTVIQVLGRPAVAMDLPGHGHSDWREDRNYGPWTHAEAVARAIDELAPNARAVVGMSMGGLTTMRLMGLRPDLVRTSVIVDVSPRVMDRVSNMTTEERGVSALAGGPVEFESFDAMLEAVARASGREPGDVWRGTRLNAKPLPDGRWAWRYDRMGPPSADAAPEATTRRTPDFSELWDDVSQSTMPLMVVRAAIFSHIPDDDMDEFTRRRPDARIEVVEGAGHSVQSDRPLELAALIDEFVPGAK